MANIQEHIEAGENVPLFELPRGANYPAPQVNVATTTTSTNEGRGTLKGSPPKEFDGTRSESETFADDFVIYWKINRANSIMKEPYSRVLMALSFMKGTKVRDWTRAQVKKLDQKVNDGLPPNNERLWDDFRDDFTRAYTDTTVVQDAYAKLKKLEMVNDDLDTYTANHENLVLRANLQIDGDAAIEHYRNGLKKALHAAVIRNFDGLPTTMEDWKKAAQVEHGKWALMKASGLVGGNKDTANKSKWGQWAEKAKNRTTPRKDSNAMDVDNVQLKPLTPEERETLFKEGRCFRCRKQGHRSRNCPQERTPNQQYRPKTSARVTEVVDDRDDASEIGSDTSTSTLRSTSTQSTKVNNVRMGPEMLIRALEGYSKEQRDEFLDQVLLKGGDF